MNTEELKPCPFCPDGGDPYFFRDNGWVDRATCRTCGFSIELDKWNRRFHPPGSPQNPHKPNAEKPTEVYIGETFLSNLGGSTETRCVLIHADPSFQHRFIVGIASTSARDTGLEVWGRQLPGFTFIAEVRK